MIWQMVNTDWILPHLFPASTSLTARLTSLPVLSFFSHVGRKAKTSWSTHRLMPISSLRFWAQPWIEEIKSLDLIHLYSPWQMASDSPCLFSCITLHWNKPKKKRDIFVLCSNLLHFCLNIVFFLSIYFSLCEGNCFQYSDSTKLAQMP